jgi:hypothetical protein
MNKSHRPPHTDTNDFGMPVSLERAVAADLWGYRWACIAFMEGVEAAATLPLPGTLEAQAREQAALLAPGVNPAARARPFAKFPTTAQEAYQASKALVERFRLSASGDPALLRQIEHAIDRTERAGRFAAVSARVTYLAVYGPPTAEREVGQ